MIFDDKNEAVKYLSSLLESGQKLPYYNLKKFLDLNDIEISNIIFEDTKDERLIVTDIYNFNSVEKTVDLKITEKSWVQYLPSIYKENKELKNFLFGLQATMFKHSSIVDNIDEIFNPQTSDFLDWLAFWFGAGFSSSVNDEVKRKLIYRLIELYNKRGTKQYLIEMVKVLTDVDIEIFERKIPDIYLQDDGFVSEKYNQKISFTIKIDEKISKNSDDEKLILKKIKNIIDKEKPAFTIYFFDYKFIKEEIKGDVLVAGAENETDTFLDIEDEDVEPEVDHHSYEKIEETKTKVVEDKNTPPQKEEDDDFFDFDFD